MRKVELRMNEEYKYKIIKKLVETNGNKKRAEIEYQNIGTAIIDFSQNC